MPQLKGYHDRAASLAAEFQANGFDASISAQKPGQFDVRHDGKLIYSKERERRFPQPGEVLSLLQG